jgi:hypothetical protein
VPDTATGQKTACPVCGQRLQIPPPAKGANKTVLGQSVPDPNNAAPPSPATPVTPPMPPRVRTVRWSNAALLAPFRAIWYVVCVVCCLFVGCTCFNMSYQFANFQVLSAPSLAPSVPAVQLPIRLSHYGAVQEGMTYKQVANLIGSPGVEDFATSESRSVTWSNPDGSSLVVLFTHDKATSRVQVGLK